MKSIQCVEEQTYLRLPSYMTFSNNTETLEKDSYLGGAVILQQPKGSLKAGLDSVLLAASLDLKEEQTVLDLGSGCFQLGLFLLARQPDISVTGVEKQPILIQYGHKNLRHSAEYNCQQIQADIVSDQLANIPSNSFDHVISNPPYFSEKNSNPNESLSAKALTNGSSRSTARKFAEKRFASDLRKWISVAKTKLKQKGCLKLSISDRQLLPILSMLRQSGFGGIEILPLFPNSNKAASRFLVSAIKASNSLDHIYGGLVLRDHKRAINPNVSQIAMNPVGVSWSEL